MVRSRPKRKTGKLDSPGASPFLKWAGGKSQLLPEILPILPAAIDTYYEPFVGGGAVFFALAAGGRFRRAVLADRNEDLVEVYKVVRDDVKGLIRLLKKHAANATDRDYYYRVRASAPEKLTPAGRAARVIYLNKTCYNGLYRVNRKGEFNVPFGRYRNPTVCNEPLLLAASRALAGVKIQAADFEEVAEMARPGDAVYFDPPYFPVSATSSFTAYDPYPFGEREHMRLADVFRRCCDRGIAAVLSNSDAPFTRRLFRGMKWRKVRAARAINSLASRRGPVFELLVAGK